MPPCSHLRCGSGGECHHALRVAASIRFSVGACAVAAFALRCAVALPFLTPLRSRRRRGHWVPRKGPSAREHLAQVTHMVRILLLGLGTVTVPMMLHQVRLLCTHCRGVGFQG